MKTIKEPARDIPVRAEADVLVVGGGPAGIMAAEAAAGDGLRVMLVESRGFLAATLRSVCRFSVFWAARATRSSRGRRSGSSTGCVHAAQRANTAPARTT